MSLSHCISLSNLISLHLNKWDLRAFSFGSLLHIGRESKKSNKNLLHRRNLFIVQIHTHLPSTETLSIWECDTWVCGGAMRYQGGELLWQQNNGATTTKEMPTICDCHAWVWQRGARSHRTYVVEGRDRFIHQLLEGVGFWVCNDGKKMSPSKITFGANK